MGQDLHVGIARAIFAQLVRGEALMHLAVALPGDDLHRRLRRHPAGEKLVGDEDHLVDAEALHHLHRVRRGATDVALRLHVGGGVDIGDDRHAGETLAQEADVLAGDRGGERAAGTQIRNQHDLVGVQEFRGLGHEVDAGLHDDAGLGLGGLARELQRVADEIGDAIINLGRLVIMREDDGVARLLRLVDRLHIGREERPLDRRHHRLHALVERRGFALDVLVPLEWRHRQCAETLQSRTRSRSRRGHGAARYQRAEGLDFRRSDRNHGPLLGLICSI